MRNIYLNEATLQADAKDQKAKAVLDSEMPLPTPEGNHYYKGPNGLLHRQFSVVDATHVLWHGLFVQVDAVPALGTAGTTKMPLTGTVLSLPRAEIGESMAGYFLRTSNQTGVAATRVGEFMDLVKRSAKPDPAAPIPVKQATPADNRVVFIPNRSGDPLKDWPIFVDAFANPAAYLVSVKLPGMVGVNTLAVVPPMPPVNIDGNRPATLVGDGADQHPPQFPLDPVKGQTYTDTSTSPARAWVFDGVAWNLASPPPKGKAA